mgnify:CR=1 FL=1
MLFPFGHGLTYGRIEYTELALSAPALPMNGELAVSARIANRGTRAAEEVVQLYVHDRTASVSRPVRELKAFRKVALAPGHDAMLSALDDARNRFQAARVELGVEAEVRCVRHMPPSVARRVNAPRTNNLPRPAPPAR